MVRRIALCALSLLVMTAGCGQKPSLKRIRLSDAASPQTSRLARATQAPLCVAIAPVVSPRETLRLYSEFLDYLSAKVSRPVELVQRRTYAEINELVRYGRCDLAFVCDGAFVEGEREFGMQLLVIPVIRGETVYHSYIIVPRDSLVASIADLKGKVFAFSDPLSTSGYFYPTGLLQQAGMTPERFFSRHIFTYSHDNSIRAVAQKLVDGAAVDSLVYDYMAARDPQYMAQVKVIHKSPPYGIPPIVLHPRQDRRIKARLRDILLSMHQDPAGRRILHRLMIDRFVIPDSQAYDSVRDLVRKVRQAK